MKKLKAFIWEKLKIFYNKTQYKRTFVAILASIIATAIFITSLCVYLNLYTIDVSSSDFRYSYTIYNGDINIKIKALSDIKNLKIKVRFYDEKESYEEYYKIKNFHKDTEKSIIFSLNDIKKELNGKEPTKVFVSKIDGYIKTKDKDKTYPAIEYNMCNFEFDLEYNEYPKSEDERYKFKTTIKNNTNRNILSIQNLEAYLDFSSKAKCKINLSRYDFTNSLKPGEERTIEIKYEVSNFKFKEETHFNAYNSTAQYYTYINKNYENIKYTLLYEE